jgi:hypothetical protein
MLLNLILLVVLFGTQKKKWNPYVAALVLGLIKFAIYLIVSKNLLWAVIVGSGFAALGSAMVYFLKRLDKSEDQDANAAPVYKPLDSQTIKFRWEYIPLVVAVLAILLGEMLFL